MSDKAVIETIETKAHRIILKDDGVTRVYSKPSHIELEDVQALLAKFSEIRSDSDRLFVLIDPTEENSMTNEARKFIVKNLKNDVAYLAVISRKKFVRLIFDIFSSVRNIGVDMKMFDSAHEAEQWIVTQQL